MTQNSFIFMKVGSHAGETWDQILERKNREFLEAGQIFWGYGGAACHPIKQVQPFARLLLQQQGEVVLVMQPVVSKADPDIIPATEYSEDGIIWKPIPKGVSVTGSRYAMVLDEIKPGMLDVKLSDLEVAVGPSTGRPAEEYLKGRTDKACLRSSPSPRKLGDEEAARKAIRKAEFTAKLKDPFAVLLR